MARFGHHLHPDDLDDTDEENDASIDPDLRLRTVRTAASTIAESIREEDRAQRRKSRNRKRSLKLFRSRSKEKKKAADEDGVGKDGETDEGGGNQGQQGPSTHIAGPRRNIYVNTQPAASECDGKGEPLVRYVRNKVKTTKYTIITFLPKNLYEQFRRVANLYFLALVIIQVFPVFGAAGAQVSMLPLVFILGVTAIKDGVEDYRRSVLDDEVNNSAATKLGDWRNFNQPRDSRPWFEKAFGLNAPGKVSKGVKRLREKEAKERREDDFVLQKSGDNAVDDDESDDRTATGHDQVLDIHTKGQWPSESSVTIAASSNAHLTEYNASSYPPVPPLPSHVKGSVGAKSGRSSSFGEGSQRGTSSPYPRSRRSLGVVDWNKRTSGTARWERTLWKKLEVGDVVLLRDNDQVPADIVVLSTSEEDGLCYLETKNLDGETNLKPRRSLKGTSSLQSEEDIEHANFVLDSEPPHANLYLYNGVLRYREYPTGAPKSEPVTINELLLRGCSVRNTSWIIGLVVFTGSDTKIMLNGGQTPSKRSKIERETNFNVVMNFIVLILMCLASAIVSGVIEGRTDTSSDFFEVGSEPSSSTIVNSIVTFASCLIAFQNIVPISLYISIEIVKTIQAYFISQDIDMFYAPYDTACVPKTWNISDDLGQIEYVFSDKTGTLTQNVMEFQRCSVNGTPYGEGVTEAQRGSAIRSGAGPGGKEATSKEEQAEQLDELKREMITRMAKAFTNRWAQPEKLTLISPQLALDLSNPSSSQYPHLLSFFRALAICHSVLPDRPDPDPTQRGNSRIGTSIVNYKAESPDEAALVAAARDVGFPFVSKTANSIDIEVLGRSERYIPLKLIEFNSTRKRMSVIVRTPSVPSTPTSPPVPSKIVLYCKGADSVIYERLSKEQDEEVKRKTQKDMEDFANGGLRTLCIAYRELTEEQYSEWARAYDAATTSTSESRDQLIDEAQEQIERDLKILGATALEDKLQEGVPEAIEVLHRAGIKLWILTGDKVQTAIEIGYSCNLLKQDMDVLILSASSKMETRSKIEAGLNKLASVLGPPTMESIAFKKKERGFIPGEKKGFAVVIDGDTLRWALERDLKGLFLNLATQCETVVCCRVSPAQKALTVKLVKEGRNAMTLSIGDGANDVAMIQEANVGCGLLGLEGSQAAMSADYAFGQFRFLTKLLVVHGRWSYIRVANMHANFFYKNVVWTFAMFWYLFYNSFDATYLYEYTFILLYNVVFTSLPVISLGAFDQDINASAALHFPQLYLRGIRGLDYTRTKFWLYMLDGLYQSVVMFFIPYLAWSMSAVGGRGGLAIAWNGKGIDSLADFGTTIAVAAIITANLYVGLNTYYWTVITWVVVIGSSAVMVIWIMIYSLFNTNDFNYEVMVLYGEVTFWATVLVSVVIAITPRFLVRFIRSSYFPLDRDIVREMWVLGDLKQQLGIQSRKSRNRNRSETLTETAERAEIAPIKNYHDRSISEATVHENLGYGYGSAGGNHGGYGGYEPASTHSPGNRQGGYSSDSDPKTQMRTGDDYIDVDLTASLPPPETATSATAVSSTRQSYATSKSNTTSKWRPQHDSSIVNLNSPSSTSLVGTGVQYVVHGDPGDAYAIHHQGAHLRSPPRSPIHLSPNPQAPFADGQARLLSPSPTPSYYSASDIPAPSPLPQTSWLTYPRAGGGMPGGVSETGERIRERSPSHSPHSPSLFAQQQAQPHPYSSSHQSQTVPLSARTNTHSNNPFSHLPSKPEEMEMTRVRSPPSAFPSTKSLRTGFSNAPSNPPPSSFSYTGNGKQSPFPSLRSQSRAESDVSRYATASEGGESEAEGAAGEEWGPRRSEDDSSTLGGAPGQRLSVYGNNNPYQQGAEGDGRSRPESSTLSLTPRAL